MNFQNYLSQLPLIYFLEKKNILSKNIFCKWRCMKDFPCQQLIDFYCLFSLRATLHFLTLLLLKRSTNFNPIIYTIWELKSNKQIHFSFFFSLLQKSIQITTLRVTWVLKQRFEKICWKMARNRNERKAKIDDFWCNILILEKFETFVS